MKLDLPLFILFEGIDGSGKSTQARLLFSYCEKKHIPAVLLQEPTGGPWGKKIREMLNGSFHADVEHQLELFILDREYDVKTNIIPSIEKGMLVILDRYYYSTAAYQGGKKYSPMQIVDMNRERDFPVPDRVYLIDIDPDTALGRVAARDPGKEEIFEKKQFLERVRENYLHLADESFLVLDGRLTEDELFASILDDLEQVTGSI